ncbi:MAG: NADH-quinone oxidoreductase subunit D [Acidobacteria bacterium]|nr:NADH-quinone oxidoreductase subunit D [Acidobacteriota bacterium]
MTTTETTTDTLRRRVQLWFGPQHPGITGNMSVQAWLEGDTLTQGITHVGYLHRGFEKLMERRKFIQSFPIVCRICVPEPDTNEYLLAAGLEELAGMTGDIPERGTWIRTLVLEMSRLQMNLMTLGGHIGSMGLGAAPNWLIAVRDYVLDRFEELTGGRIYHMYIIYGGVRRDLPEGFGERMEETLTKIEEKLPLVDNVIFDSSVFRRRTVGVGVVPEEWVDEMSLSGPIVRAMGLPRDIRKDFPYLIYPELDFEVVTTTGSDIYARAWIRRQEIQQSIDLIRQILARMPEGPYCAKLPNMLTWTIPPGQTYVRAEATRGEMGYYTVTDGSDKVRRIHVRGPSFVHGVALLERMIPGTNIADLSPLMVSLQVCPPEIER